MWSFVLAALAATFAFLVSVLAVALLANRARLARGGAAARATALAGPTLQSWAADGAVDEIARALRALPPREALAQLAVLTATRLPHEAAAALGALVVDEPWARDAMRGSRSLRWTRRLEAARLLPTLGRADRVRTLRRLLRDRHVAVRAAATAALPRLATEVVVEEVVRALPDQPEALRRLQARTLRGRWQMAERPLVECLAAPCDEHALATWVSAAAALATPVALAACVPHHRHRSRLVRAEVARALATAFSADALAALVTLLDDSCADVRAEAARAVASYGGAATRLLPRLAALLGDGAWPVRYRAALSLALLGEPGRRALRSARTGPDRYARDMAALVAGLPEGTVLELANA